MFKFLRKRNKRPRPLGWRVEERLRDDAVYLASFPRSGNTMLRTVLHHCFGLKSGSMYRHDLRGNAALEEFVGHVERDGDGRLAFEPGALPLIKTHDPPKGSEKAIYVVRNGIAACQSLAAWYGGEFSLEQIIRGRARFGTWSEHVADWAPWERPNTLFLRYEELAADPIALLPRLADFLGREPISRTIPPRERIADVDGRFVRRARPKDEPLPAELLALFERINGPMMRRLGYAGG